MTRRINSLNSSQQKINKDLQVDFYHIGSIIIYFWTIKISNIYIYIYFKQFGIVINKNKLRKSKRVASKWKFLGFEMGRWAPIIGLKKLIVYMNGEYITSGKQRNQIPRENTRKKNRILISYWTGCFWFKCFHFSADQSFVLVYLV